MLVNKGNHGNCVDFRFSEIKQNAMFSWISTLLVCTLFSQTGAQFSAVELTKANKAVRRVCASKPQLVFFRSLCGLLDERVVQGDTKVLG
jgi:hypothetical protein